MPMQPPPHSVWPSPQWLEAYMASRSVQKKVEPKKEEVKDMMMGGWQFEGKERPETPKICIQCQGINRYDHSVPPSKEMWCEACLAGERLGSPPADPKKVSLSPMEDVRRYNQAFFG